MLALKKVAITGGVSSGKSSVCRLLAERGAYQVSSDTIIHHLLSDNSPCIKQVVELLGARVLTDGKIDRKKVADIVFTNQDKLNALEAILHPCLLREIDQIYNRVNKEQKYAFFVVEIPLVQEIGKESAFDFIVTVVCDEAISKSRWKQAGFSEDSYNKRMQRQWPTAKKAHHAHFTLTNNGTYEDLTSQVIKLIAFLTTANEE
ncbi:MAG: dephospho-CoA kinase [Chlamydiota bacterium]